MKYLIVLLLLILAISSVSATTRYAVQGQEFNVALDHPGGTCWYFNENLSVGDSLYDIPTNPKYVSQFCTLTDTQTASMEPGQYKMLYTYPGTVNDGSVYQKGIKDIRYINGSLVSILSGVNPVNIEGRSPSYVLENLERMIRTNGIDNINYYSIEVIPPSLTIDSVVIIGRNELFITGKSTLNNNTIVTVKFDELERYALHDSANFTVKAFVVRPFGEGLGTWGATMVMPLENVAPGWHNVDVYAEKMHTSVRVPVYQDWTPHPTPTQYLNYFGNGSIKPVVVTVTIPVTVVKEKYIQLTSTPTPDITDALGGKIPYPYEPGDTIPWWVGILSLFGIAVVALLKGWKLK